MRLPAGVRRVTDPLFANFRVPIISGVNRGMWWSLASSGSRYATGRRAATQIRLIQDLVRTGDVVFAIGAHHGYVTLAAARKVGGAGAVHAFEPSRTNRARLERHVAWNSLLNVTVHPFALAHHDGESTFGGSGTSKMFALGAGSEVVQVRSADSLRQQRVLGIPDFVKIDVEGAEADTLRGLMPVLSQSSRLFIAMHHAEADRQSVEMLQVAGFTCVASHELKTNRTGTWQSDPDLFCFGPAYQHHAQDLATLRDAGF